MAVLYSKWKSHLISGPFSWFFFLSLDSFLLIFLGPFLLFVQHKCSIHLSISSTSYSIQLQFFVVFRPLKFRIENYLKGNCDSITIHHYNRTWLNANISLWKFSTKKMKATKIRIESTFQSYSKSIWSKHKTNPHRWIKWTDAYNWPWWHTREQQMAYATILTFNSIQSNLNHSIQFDLIWFELEICLDKSSWVFFCIIHSYVYIICAVCMHDR